MELRELPDAHIECRTIGHAWHRVAPSPEQLDRIAGVKGMVLMALRCSRCGGSRADVIRTNSGHVQNRRYIYPESYLMPKGMKRARRDVFRVRLLEICIEEFKAQRRGKNS